MSRRRLAAFVVGLGVTGSQAGHLLAYQLRYGAAAQQVQTSGAHAYFPTLARTGIGALAACLLAGVLLVGLGRVAHGRPLHGAGAPGYLGLVAVLFTVQFACFAGQETIEAAVAGFSPPSAATVLLWGMLGQLPLAAIGALALRWLLARVGPAIAALQRLQLLRHPIVPTLVTSAGIWDQPFLASRVRATSPGKRGPPPLVRFSSI